METETALPLSFRVFARIGQGMSAKEAFTLELGDNYESQLPDFVLAHFIGGYNGISN